MSEKTEITFMQTRLIRLASEVKPLADRKIRQYEENKTNVTTLFVQKKWL